MLTVYLEHHDEKSAKFWQIHVNGCSHTVTFGKIGTAGQSKTKTFDGEIACQKDADKLIKAKKAKGYSEDGTAVTTAEKTTKNNTQSKNKQDKTAILAEFDEIIKNGDLTQIIPFLTAHKNGNVSELKKRLNKARHYYLDWQDLNPTGKSDWGRRGDANHERMLFCLALGLLSTSDFNSRWFDCFIRVLRYMDDPKFYTIADYKNNTYQMIFDIIKHFEFKEVFNAYFAESIKQELGGVSYWILHKLETHHLIDYHAQAFAIALAVSSLPKTLNWENKLSLDEYREQFLQLDIPSRDLKSLFEYETNISWDYVYGLKIPKEYKSSTWKYVSENGGLWLYLIPEFVKQGKLERDWVLQKCVEIQSNFWKQTSKKFFKELFLALNPSEGEILALQPQLFTLLHSEFKPTVNFAIDILKPLISHQAFDLNEYFSFVNPIMMNIEYKGAIKTILMQLDKLLKANPNLIKSVYPLLSNVLFVANLSLQERAVKLLIKHANQNSLGDEWENLTNQIEMLFNSLPNDIKMALKPLYQTQNEANEPQTENIVQNLLSDINYQYDPVVRIDYFANDKKIELYSEFNDILFNFGQLEHSLNPIHLEIFMASWLNLKQNGQINNDNIEQFKTVSDKYRHRVSNNYVFYLFKIDFLNFIYQNKDEKVNEQYFFHTFKFLKSYQEIFKQFIHLNQLDNSLPLLSTPTHFPAFIEPKTLVERLISYQDANIEIDLTDYAIALARMPRVNIEPAIQLLSEIKNELIVESLKFAFGLIEIIDTVPSIQQMKLMGVEYTQEQMDKFNADIIERENKLANMNNNPNIAKGLLDKAKKAVENLTKVFDGNHKNSDYQAWRGVFATITKTHYPNIELDYSHEYKKIFDKIVNNEHLALDYVYQPIAEYNYDTRKDIETGDNLIQFKLNEYFRFAHTSDIYRQSCYLMGKNQYIYFYTDMIYQILLAKYLMPLNQNDYDKFLSSCLFCENQAINKHAIPLLEKIMSEDYPYNAYTQYILVACLFAKDKAVRLAGIDAVIYAIGQFKLDIEIFARHSSEWIHHFSAPFSRYVECITQLSQYESIYQKVVLEIIEKTIVQIEFKDKLPTNFKKYLENYYLLLSNLNQKPSDDIMIKLNEFVAISNSLKAIVNKIGKLQ